MNALSSIINYTHNIPTRQTSQGSDEVTSIYEDRSEDNKPISLTKIHYHYPKSTYTKFTHYESLEDLCTHIALTRNPQASKTLKKEVSDASFSAVNRADISTEVSISKGLKKLLGLENRTDQEIKDFLQIKSIYKHNSEFNGYSYTDHTGKLVQISSAIESSADRKASEIQNLTALKVGGKNLLYTGRPDTLEKAKDQALFILSHKLDIPLLEKALPSETPSQEIPQWLQGKKGITWNPKTQCIELPYVVYSVMSDSNVQHAYYNIKKDTANNEKLFIKKEEETLNKLKKDPILIKDSSGKVFKLQCKPILLSQCFNAFETFKGFAGEGTLSPILMKKGWDEIYALIKKNPVKLKKMQKHVRSLNSYFNGSKHLSSLHLFLHMNIILSEINGVHEKLPLVLHCKSSTDRTGIGAAILSTLKQFKRLKIPIPTDVSLLTQDVRFKELFFLNWAPTWHQRSKYSRDTLGISFGSGLQQNPVLAECLPKRFLQSDNSKIHRIKSGIFAAINFIGLSIHQYLNVSIPFSFALTKHIHGIDPLSSQKIQEWASVLFHSRLQLFTPSYLPKTFINEKGNKFKSKSGEKLLSPLQKTKKPWILFN